MPTWFPPHLFWIYLLWDKISPGFLPLLFLCIHIELWSAWKPLLLHVEVNYAVIDQKHISSPFGSPEICSFVFRSQQNNIFPHQPSLAKSHLLARQTISSYCLNSAMTTSHVGKFWAGNLFNKLRSSHVKLGSSNPVHWAHCETSCLWDFIVMWLQSHFLQLTAVVHAYLQVLWHTDG